MKVSVFLTQIKQSLINRIFRSTLFYGCILFSMYGLVNEIIFTGIFSWFPTLKGTVSLLMIPVYSVSYLLLVSNIYKKLTRFAENIFLRSFFVVLIVYFVEYIFGNVYFFMGFNPWKYHHGWASEFSNGAITLYYLPFWYIFAFIVVHIGDIVSSMAPIFEKLFFQETDEFLTDFYNSVEQIKKSL